jgi:RNA polymerase sigma-70 factor (ECF subfamily)
MDALVSRYHARLLDFAFRHLRDREASADIAQTALVRVFQAARDFRERASFRTWLYTIVLNLIRDECRRRSSRRESLSSEIEAHGDVEAYFDEAERSPESIALNRIAASRMWNAVGCLNENHRSAIILKFREGLTYEETAAVMDKPVGTVKSWVHYALKALRESLEPVECEG